MGGSSEPLSSEQVVGFKGSSVLNVADATDTQQLDSSVGGSNSTKVMTGHSHVGISARDPHHNEFALDGVLKTPEPAVPEGISSKSIARQKPSIPKSLSLDRIPSLNHMYSADGSFGKLRYKSSNRSQITGTESLRKRDELLTAFRSLDGEFHK